LTHLLKRAGVIANLKRGHRLRKLLLHLGAARLVDELLSLGRALLNLEDVVVEKLLCLLGRRVRGFELLPRAVKRGLLFLKRGDVGASYVVAAGSDCGL